MRFFVDFGCFFAVEWSKAIAWGWGSYFFVERRVVSLWLVWGWVLLDGLRGVVFRGGC